MFELIFLIFIGLLFVIIGWRIWKKEQINLIHDYHYRKVSIHDKKPYTEKMGQACILMGMGMALTGVIDFTTSSLYGWIAFGIFFMIGIIIMLMAQVKYNGGVF